MIYKSRQTEQNALLTTAEAMCAAARTAPKAVGRDLIETLVLTEDDKEALATEMEAIADELFGGDRSCWYYRDAANLRASGGVVLVGVRRTCRGIAHCGCCGFADCAGCMAAGGTCAFATIDLGIALGSAAKVAAERNVDNRIMFSAGKAAARMGYVEGDVLWHAIPLSISGKSIYFDRKPK